MKIRNKRIKPGLDDKILSSWNALMITGYTKAYRVFGEEDFLKTAITNANFLIKNAIAADGEMTRNYKNGKPSINALLDDYAFTIAAFVELYQATFDEKWLNEANKLMGYTLEHFFDKASEMFFYTHHHYADLIAQKDGIIGQCNSFLQQRNGKEPFFAGSFFK